MRTAVALGAVAASAGAALLVGCAAMAPENVTFSETDLALMLARQFPQDRKLLEVLEVQLANPQLKLLPDRNRLSTALDVAANDRLFGSHARAHLALDYALRFEPSDHSLRLKDVRVQELRLDADSNPLRGQAQRLGVLVAEHVLENMTIYRMKPEQADRMDRLGLEARSVNVTARGLEIAIGARAR